jgi:GTPase SAR1 family protein
VCAYSFGTLPVCAAGPPRRRRGRFAYTPPVARTLLAGLDRHGPMMRVYSKEAHGAFIVHDVTRPESLENVRSWLHKLADGNPAFGEGSVPIVLLGNKSDLLDAESAAHTRPSPAASKMAQELGFTAAVQVSAQRDRGLREARDELVAAILRGSPADDAVSFRVRLRGPPFWR